MDLNEIGFEETDVHFFTRKGYFHEPTEVAKFLTVQDFGGLVAGALDRYILSQSKTSWSYFLTDISDFVSCH